MKRTVLVFVFCLIFLSSCSSPMKEKPDDISQDIWDKSIQYAILADQYQGIDGDIDMVELMSVAGKLKYSKNQNTNEQDLTNNVRNMVVGKFEEYYGNNEEMIENGVKHFEEGRKVVVGLIGEGMLNQKNLREDIANVSNNNLDEAEDKPEGYSYIKAYQEENRLKARDVQFDMENNLDKNFVVEGTATLDDYYNYGFGNEIEDNYFCARVVSDDGSDSWYLYFERGSFKELFEALKSGSVYVSATSEIPSYRYVKGQGNMAQVREVEFK